MLAIQALLVEFKSQKNPYKKLSVVAYPCHLSKGEMEHGDRLAGQLV